MRDLEDGDTLIVTSIDDKWMLKSGLHVDDIVTVIALGISYSIRVKEAPSNGWWLPRSCFDHVDHYNVRIIVEPCTCEKDFIFRLS